MRFTTVALAACQSLALRPEPGRLPGVSLAVPQEASVPSGLLGGILAEMGDDPENASAENASAENASAEMGDDPEQPQPENASAENASAENASAENASAENASAENASAEMGDDPEQPQPENASAENAPAEMGDDPEQLEPQYCLRITTGGEPNNNGYLAVHVMTGEQFLEVAGNDGVPEQFNRNAVVADACYQQPISRVEVQDLNTNGWAGSILYSTDAENFVPMSCEGCTGHGDTSAITVDGNADGWGSTSLHCLSGRTCRLFEKNTLRYCLRINTGTTSQNGGVLTIRVNTQGREFELLGGGGRHFDPGEIVSESCYQTPISWVEVQNPTTNGWEGSILYSTDAENDFIPMSCEACTGRGSTSEIAVDGNADSRNSFPLHCLSGRTCRLFERDTLLYCLRIVTGTADHDDGNLILRVFTVSSLFEVAGGQHFSRGDIVSDSCYQEPITRVQVENRMDNAWVGSILYSTDAEIFNAMECVDCTGDGDTTAIVVDGNADGNRAGYAHCLNGMTCDLREIKA